MVSIFKDVQQYMYYIWNCYLQNDWIQFVKWSVIFSIYLLCLVLRSQYSELMRIFIFRCDKYISRLFPIDMIETKVIISNYFEWFVLSEIWCINSYLFLPANKYNQSNCTPEISAKWTLYMMFQYEYFIRQDFAMDVHDGVMTWKRFPHYWPCLRKITSASDA